MASEALHGTSELVNLSVLLKPEELAVVKKKYPRDFFDRSRLKGIEVVERKNGTFPKPLGVDQFGRVGYPDFDGVGGRKTLETDVYLANTYYIIRNRQGQIDDVERVVVAHALFYDSHNGGTRLIAHDPWYRTFGEKFTGKEEWELRSRIATITRRIRSGKPHRDEFEKYLLGTASPVLKQTITLLEQGIGFEALSKRIGREHLPWFSNTRENYQRHNT